MRLNIDPRQLHLMTIVVSLGLLFGVLLPPAHRQIADAQATLQQIEPELTMSQGVLASTERIRGEYLAARVAARPLAPVSDAATAQRTVSRVVPDLAKTNRIHVTDLELGDLQNVAPQAVVPDQHGAQARAPQPAAEQSDGGFIPLALHLEGRYDDLRRFMAALPHAIPLLEEQTWAYTSATRSPINAGDHLTVNLTCALHLPSTAARQGLETDLSAGTPTLNKSAPISKVTR